MNNLISSYRTYIILVIVVLAGAILILHYDVSDDAHYVTSETCADCHQARYTSWKTQTLHPRIFHPVNNPEEILGDFDSDDPLVNFKKEDIKFVVGSKWEQVYARKIDGDYYPFTAKWMITTQKWVPYKVKKWRETPFSKNCNGCHTTGFNADTFEFVEFGVGCEACHGPASQHLQQERKLAKPWCSVCHANDEPAEDNGIIVSVKNSVCGQCHSRGQQSVDNEHMQASFRFPLNYKPGEELPEDYKPITQEIDSKGVHWWAIGLSKNRHQEFADFSVSKHAQALEKLKSKSSTMWGELKDECLECHSADYRFAKEGEKPTIASAQIGLSCVVCHEPHGLNRQFRSLKIDEQRCGLCHIDTLALTTAENAKAHYPCPLGTVSCADCHMPYIVKSGGTYPIRSHAFKIVPPAVSETIDMPNSCQNGGCHNDKSLKWAKNAFKTHYPDYPSSK